LLAIINPASVISDVAVGMASVAAGVEALAVAPPQGTAQNSPPKEDSLTPAEAEQLKTGAVAPLRTAVDQLIAPEPDLPVIIARVQSIPGYLSSITKPSFVVAELRKKAMSVDTQVRALKAVAAGADAALAMAVGEWQKAVVLLTGLVAKTSETAPAGTAAPPPEEPGAKEE
jgi:hypothetical protein